MKLSFLVKPAAQREFDEAFDWYEDKEVGRGDLFAAALHDALQFVCQKPETHPTVYRAFAASNCKDTLIS